MRLRSLAVAAALVLVAACGNSGSERGASESGSSLGRPASGDAEQHLRSDQPGVTDTEIRVSGIATEHSPIGGDEFTAKDGVRAYFDMVNASGGLYGRKLRFVEMHDDGFTNAAAAATTAIAQDNIFALLPVASFFDFASLDVADKAGYPSFGIAVNNSYDRGPNRFGNGYGGTDFLQPVQPYLAHKVGASSIGIIAYNDEASAPCAEQLQRSATTFGVAVGFVDMSLSFGDLGGLATDVARMKDAGVGFVTTCLDRAAAITLAQEMRRQGLQAPQLLLQGYDHDFVRDNAEVLEGYFVAVLTAPSETDPRPRGLADFLTWMDRGGYSVTESAASGWFEAAVFVEGLRRAGPGFTQQSVIDALNELQDFTADGFGAPVSYPAIRAGRIDEWCAAIVQIHDGAFRPAFSEAGKPFLCLPTHATTIDELRPIFR